MAHDLHPFSHRARALRGELKGAAFERREVASDAPLLPSLYLSWGGSSVSTEASLEGGALTISWRLASAPDWLTLNIDLGIAQLAVGDVIGLALRGSVTGGAELPVLLRSKVGDELIDTLFDEPICLGDGLKPRVVFCQIGPDEESLSTGGYHTLIFRLPVRDVELKIDQLELFHIPKSDAFSVALPSLANAFV